MKEELEYLKKELARERAARMEAERQVHDLTMMSDRQKTFLLSLQTGVMVEDENRHILLVNQHFCNLFGIPASPFDMVGWDCSDTAEQSKHLFAEPEIFTGRITTLLAERRLVLQEEIWLADGRCFSRDYVPVFIEGRYKGHLWNYSDITRQKTSEIKLKRREEKYRRIIENMNIGLLEVDLQGHIHYANQSFCTMSGYLVDELIGKVAEDLFMEHSNDDKKIILERHEMRKKGLYDAYEVRIRHHSGEPKWWLISGAPIYDDIGNPIGSIGIHLDITMQKDLEINLTQARKIAEETARAKEVFLANMSHEIRTPLNAILGLGNQLSKTSLDPIQESFLNAINTSSDNLLVIINDILDYSKIEAGKMRIEHIGFEMTSLLRQIELTLSQNARSKGLEFILETDESLAPVLIGDPYRINQAILNLLSNSIKFTEKGTILLGCRVKDTSETEQQLTITVEDTGIGIDPKFLGSIFQKFSQENVNAARKYGGTGLGMAITYQLVSLMKGTIEIESQKGEGTKAEITLRFPIGNKRDLPVKEERHVNIDVLRGKRILIVEDNQLNRVVAGTILGTYKVEVTEAVNGQEAIDLMKTHDFDLVLMDMQMPVIDGLTATKIIRSEISRDVPIIALTANALQGEQDKCMEAGMDDFITKPFIESRLLEVILKHLDHSERPAM